MSITPQFVSSRMRVLFERTHGELADRHDELVQELVSRVEPLEVVDGAVTVSAQEQSARLERVEQLLNGLLEALRGGVVVERFLVHDSPSIGAADGATSAASDLIVGAASDAHASPSSGASDASSEVKS